MPRVNAFEIHIADAEIDELRNRLAHLRWADLPLGDGWSAGIDARFLRELIAAWRNFDWRAVERRINTFDNFLVEVDGQNIHMLHQRSAAATAVPLLLIHGWPGSFLEFIELVAPLTSSAEMAFHVVCPSIPGYGFSDKPAAPGMHVRRVAEIVVAAMEQLGYDRFYVQGGDWGSMIAAQIARQFPQRCLGLHLNMVAAPSPKDLEDPLALVEADELPWLGQTEELWRTGMGYYAVQSTCPHTLAYALNDSPLGLAAWLGEKFMRWSDGGTARLGVPLDALLAHLSLYWYTQTIGTAMRLYYETAQIVPAGEYVSVPTGAAIFPAEIVKSPRAWAARMFNLVHWRQQERGGHFAALEVPELLAADIRRFVKVTQEYKGH
jgi:microsomal epoxide hydrolase